MNKITKIILSSTAALLFLIPLIASGYTPHASNYVSQPGDVKLEQKTSDGTPVRWMTFPTGGNAILGWDYSYNQPVAMNLGTGMSYDGDTLNLSISTSSISGLQSILDFLTASLSTLQSQLGGKASTSALSTVALTGSYNDLSNKPTYDYQGAASSSQSFAIQRANHTGTQSVSTITGLATVATSGAYTDLSGKPTLDISYEGTTQRTGSFPIFKSATVASGVAVVHLTTDGNSGGTALCTNGIIQDSVSPITNDALALYQMSWAFSNSNKTLTVTANKFTTANILSGVLGQAAANGSVVKVSVWCY